MSDSPEVTRGRRWGGFAVGVAVLAVFAAVLADPTARVVGSASVDGFGTQWFFWFAGEVLAGRQPVGVTDLLFHPWGKDLYAHTGGNLVDAWLATPLRLVLGPALGFDAWVAIVLLTNAWAGARLAAALGAPSGWRWVAGIALVLNPYVLGELDLGRPTQAWLAPAGFALAGLATMRSAREAALAGFALGMSALVYWYYGLVLAVVAALAATWRLVLGPARGIALGTNAIAAGVALFVTLPFAAPMFTALDAGVVPGLLALDGSGPLAPLALRTVEGDAQGVYVVAPLLAASGSLLDDDGLRFNAGVPALFAVHLVVGALGVVALFVASGAGGTRRWGWVAGALLLSLFVAGGPVVALGDQLIPNRPWIALVAELDVLRRWWWPGRAVFLLHLLVAGLVPVLLRALPRRAGIAAGAGLLVLLVGLLRREALLPLPAWDATVPPSLRCLAAAPPGAVIDVPLLVDQKNLWFQTVHGKPLLGGMLLKKTAFAPAEFTEMRATDPLLRAIEGIGDRHYTREIATAAPEARAALAAYGYQYVVARIDAFWRPRVGGDGTVVNVSEWSRPRRQLLALLGAPAFEDDVLAIWTLDGAPLACGPDGEGRDGR